MRILASVSLILLSASALEAADPSPVIDVHLHADPVSAYGPPGQYFCMDTLNSIPPHDPATGPWPEHYMRMHLEPTCDDPIPSARDDESLMLQTLEAMRRLNITAVISGPPEIVAKWKSAEPEKVVAGRSFNVIRDAETSPSDLAGEFALGKFRVLAEVTNQYSGVGPDAPEFSAYWQMAEEHDIPVGIHIGSLPPGSPYLFEGARVRLGNPLLLEEVLVRHPRLRVYVMHSGAPFFDNIVALMQVYPQLYAGTGVLQAIMSEADYGAFLERMVDAGLGKRIMYGTDQMIWPGMIERSLNVVGRTKALTPEQKQDFLYNNAARFFRIRQNP